MTPPNWYGQHGEDKVLSELLPGPTGVFVEVGAADGVEGSNTLHFEERGWSGLLIEANPSFAESCRRARTSQVVEVAVTAPGAPTELPFQIVPDIPQLSGLELDPETLRTYGVEQLETVYVSCRTLDDVLEEHLAGQEIDFVTIDVEGHEWSVLQGFTIETWKPRIIIIERNFQPNWRIVRHLRQHGYAYTRTTGVNDWFERDVAQSATQLAAAIGPLYLKGVRPLVKKGLARVHLLDAAARLRASIPGRSGVSAD